MCVCVCVYVGWHMWVFYRINNLDGFAAGEDPEQTWLKLLAAASERGANMPKRERSHHAEFFLSAHISYWILSITPYPKNRSDLLMCMHACVALGT